MVDLNVLIILLSFPVCWSIQCEYGYFYCKFNSKCIKFSWFCDGDNDCGDNEDENFCTTKTTDGARTVLFDCLPGYYKCRDDIKCITFAQFCNGKKDCPLDDDESFCHQIHGTRLNCEAGNFQCQNGSKCIKIHSLCDGVNDCGDNEDEDYCKTTTEAMPSTDNFGCTLHEFYCSATKKCIPEHLVCNDQNDCGNCEDEQSCLHNDYNISSVCPWRNSSPKHRGCSHKCIEILEDVVCSCYDGFCLSKDYETCQDINECSNIDACDHFCTNTKGGFQCHCAQGYVLQEDERKCVVEKSGASLVYLKGDELTAVHIKHSRPLSSGVRLPDVKGMDFDAQEKVLFWTNWRKGLIVRFLPELNRQEIMVRSVHSICLVKWDWLARNIYFTDDEGSISACDEHGRHCIVILHSVAQDISSLVLNSNFGIMFWSVFNTILRKKYGVIEVAHMDGTNRKTLISAGTYLPTSLVIDHVFHYIYWVDAASGTIERANFKGHHRMKIVGSAAYHPITIAFFGNNLYFTDGNDRLLKSCNRLNGFNCTEVFNETLNPKFLIIAHEVEQPKGPNHCEHENCPELCLLSGSTFSCMPYHPQYWAVGAGVFICVILIAASVFLFIYKRKLSSSHKEPEHFIQYKNLLKKKGSTSESIDKTESYIENEYKSIK